MSEPNADPAPPVVGNDKPVEVEQQTMEVGTPTKRTPKRKADAFKKESEELLKTLGVSLDMEDGRRRTRSSARGGTPTTPTPATPPAKRAREAASPKKSEEKKSPSTATTPKKRGLQGERKRLLVLMDPALPKEYTDKVKESAGENDEMDATEVTATTTKTAVDEEKDAGKTQEATVSKNAEEKQENENEADRKEDEESDKKEVLADTKQDDKDTAEIKVSPTEPEDNAVAKQEETPAEEKVNDTVPAKVEDATKTDNAQQDTECLEADKPEEAMEVDAQVEQLPEAPSTTTAETKSDETKQEKEKEVVDAVCASNGSNTTTTPEKCSAPEVVAKPDSAEKPCVTNDKEPAATINADSTVVEPPAPVVQEPAQETKVDENNSSSTAEEEKEAAPVNDVTGTKASEKVIPVDGVETKVVTSDVTATTIEPLPTPE